jgi:hypothetical protein
VRAVVYALVLAPPCLIVLAAYTGRPNDGGPLPTIAGFAPESRIEPDLTRVARQLAGRGEVRCWSAADWERRADELRGLAHRLFGGRLRDHNYLNGYVSAGADRVNLPNRMCFRLESIMAGATPDPFIAYAARVFAHELTHLKGEKSEAKASCYGLQTVRSVAQALGASTAYADELAALAWEQYPYRPSCHDDDELDLHPESSRWP